MKTHSKNSHSFHHSHHAEDSVIKKQDRLDHFKKPFSGEGSYACGRHEHPFGRGRGHSHGGGFKRHFGGGNNFPVGRKLSSNELQLILLALLEEKSAHGYDLIRQLEALSDGFYVPSPGMVYPALTYLSEVGHTDIEQEGSRKLYRLTDLGKEYLNSQRQQANDILEALETVGHKMANIREAFSDKADDETLSDATRQAHHRLRSVLKAKRHSSSDVLQKIISVLNKATAEISDIS
ncbi:PadR family transcriptional regulator [Zymomonas mobilis]|uniref:PadR family transcriptional regulator n=1 Tax=Zymomonas mobilis TaxID=542 RepID=UPI0039ECDFA7